MCVYTFHACASEAGESKGIVGGRLVGGGFGLELIDGALGEWQDGAGGCGGGAVVRAHGVDVGGALMEYGVVF